MIINYGDEIASILKNFDMDKALELSDRLHKTEEEIGLELSISEDRLWFELSCKIEAERRKLKC